MTLPKPAPESAPAAARNPKEGKVLDGGAQRAEGEGPRPGGPAAQRAGESGEERLARLEEKRAARQAALREARAAEGRGGPVRPAQPGAAAGRPVAATGAVKTGQAGPRAGTTPANQQPGAASPRANAAPAAQPVPAPAAPLAAAAAPAQQPQPGAPQAQTGAPAPQPPAAPAAAQPRPAPPPQPAAQPVPAPAAAVAAAAAPAQQPQPGAPQAQAGAPAPQPPAAPTAAQPRPAPAPQPAAQPVPAASQPSFPPAIGPSRMKARHYGIAISFLLCVLIPVVVTAWYLWARAADQYASFVGFSVQREETDPALAILGGVTSLNTSSSADTDILYEYLFSQALVTELDAELDLRAIWARPFDTDPVFAYAAPGTVEDLTDYWSRMVTVFYDSTTRLIEVRVLAFDPQDAQRIAAAIYARSTDMVNDLANTARTDALRYAEEELEEAKNRLRDARTAVTEFRNKHQLVDPSADVAQQSGVLGMLQQQLVTAMIDLDTLRLSTQDGDPRILPAERKVKVIEDRIAAERMKLGGSDSPDVYARIVAEFEGLAVDREFAEAAYRAALTSYDVAQSEARRQGRYLAAHVPPTLAEASRFPNRLMLLSIVAGILLSVWAIGAMLYYSLRDRR